MRGKQDDTDETVYDFFKRRMNEEVRLVSCNGAPVGVDVCE